MLIKPEVAALGTVLRQPEAFVPLQAPLGGAHPEEGNPGPLVNGITTGYVHKHEGFAVKLSMMNMNAQGRGNHIGADLHQQVIERRHLFAGHALNPSIVTNAAQEPATTRVGKGAYFVGKVVSTRAGWLVALEFDLLELPAAVLPQPQTLEDVPVADGHRLPPGLAVSG